MKLIKSFSIYTLTGVIGAGTSFIVMPILTHYLSPKDYGTLSLFNTYVLILVPIISCNVYGFINIEYYKKPFVKSKFRKLFSSLYWFPFGPFIVLFFLSWFFKSELSSIVNIPENYIYWLPLVALLVIYFDQLLNFLVIGKKALLYGIANLSKVIIEVGMSLYLIIFLSYQWEGRIQGVVTALFILFLFSIFYYYKRGLLRIIIKKSNIKAGLIFGIPLIIHVLGKLVVNQSDKIFIAEMVSIEEVGYYNIGYLVGSIILIISSAFNNSYTPYLFERLADLNKEKKIELVRVAYIFLISLFVILIFVVLLSPVLFRYFINENFITGNKYVVWIGLSYFFWSGYLVFSGYLFYLKKTNYLAYFSILNIVLNLSLNYVLILKFGTIGAAYATFISFFIIFILVAYTSNKLLPMPWFSFRKILNIQ